MFIYAVPDKAFQNILIFRKVLIPLWERKTNRALMLFSGGAILMNGIHQQQRVEEEKKTFFAIL